MRVGLEGDNPNRVTLVEGSPIDLTKVKALAEGTVMATPTQSI